MTRGLLGLALVVAPAPVAADDRLILRDARVLTGTVQAFGPDGITIATSGRTGPTRLAIDEVESGTVTVKQAEFNRLLADCGEPVFRLRQRLRNGDFREVSEPSEKVFPTYAGRSSGVAHTVCLATYWGRIANHRFEAAVEPLLACQQMAAAKGFEAEPKVQVSDSRKLTVDPKTRLAADLPPVWFDPAAAKAALPAVEVRLKGWPTAPPELSLYAATLALTAGDTGALARHRETLAKGKDLGWALALLEVQAETAGKEASRAVALAGDVDKLPEAVRPAALYWSGLGLSRVGDANIRRQGIVLLLSLPAKYGETAPELAAAGLSQAARAMDDAKDTRGAAIVRSELLTNFRGTAHAARLAGPAKAGVKDGP